MSKHLVLAVKPYDFKNNDGERVQGAKITYTNRKPSSRENEMGYPPLMVQISDMNVVETLKEVPAVYDLEFEQVTGKDNKPVLILTDAELIKPIDFSAIFA